MINKYYLLWKQIKLNKTTACGICCRSDMNLKGIILLKKIELFLLLQSANYNIYTLSR